MEPAMERALSYYHMIQHELGDILPTTPTDEVDAERWEHSMTGILKKMATVALKKKKKKVPYPGFLTVIMAESYLPVDNYQLEVKKSHLAKDMPPGNL